MNWLMLAGSLIGVLVIAAVAHRLRLGGDPRIDRDEVLALAALQNFTPADLIVDRAGFAALATDGSGGFLLFRQHGAHFVAQPLRPPLAARLDHRFLTIGKQRRAVTLDLGDAASIWAARLRTLRA